MPDPTPADVYRAYNRAENEQDHAAMAALLAPDVAVEINGHPGLASADEDAVAMVILFDAYPDYRREIVEILESGASVVVRWRMCGTVSEEYAGRLDDLDQHGCSIVEVADGRISHAWLYAPAGAIQTILATVGDHLGPRRRDPPAPRARATS